jgi:hypothetical protein
MSLGAQTASGVGTPSDVTDTRRTTPGANPFGGVERFRGSTNCCGDLRNETGRWRGAVDGAADTLGLETVRCMRQI